MKIVAVLFMHDRYRRISSAFIVFLIAILELYGYEADKDPLAGRSDSVQSSEFNLYGNFCVLSQPPAIPSVVRAQQKLLVYHRVGRLWIAQTRYIYGNKVRRWDSGPASAVLDWYDCIHAKG